MLMLDKFMYGVSKTRLITIEVLKVKMNDTKTFKDFPYEKLFEICDRKSKAVSRKISGSKWGK